MFRRGSSCSWGTRDRVNRDGEIRRTKWSRFAPCRRSDPAHDPWHAGLARFANGR